MMICIFSFLFYTVCDKKTDAIIILGPGESEVALAGTWFQQEVGRHDILCLV
jgi:hypothetical protein